MKTTRWIALATVLAFLTGCGNQVIRSAEIYLQQNDHQKARTYINQSLVNVPAGKDRAEIYYILAKITHDDIVRANSDARKQTDVVKVKEAFDRRIALIGQMLVERDSSLANGKLFSGALDTLREALWIDYFNAGVAPFNKKEWSDAITLFKLAWALKNDDATPARLIGQAYLQDGKGALALEWFNKAINSESKDNQDFASRISIADYYYDDSKWTEALKFYNQVLSLSPPKDTSRIETFRDVSVRALGNKAVCLDQLDRPEEATKAYADALEKQPDNGILWYNYGKRCFETKKNSEAVRAMSEVLRLDPADADALLLMGLTKFQDEKYEDAEKYLRETLKYKPKSSTAWVNLVGAIGNQLVSLGEKGNDAKRKELMQKLMEAKEEMKKNNIE